jgi:Tol biopolymer transport system component
LKPPVLVTLWLAALGCVLPILNPMVLPEEPIAFMHWTGSSAKKRFTAFGNAAELPPLPPSRSDPDRREENEIRAHLRAEKSLSNHERLAARPGRLMLFWPRSGELTKVAEAPLGAHPLAWSSDHKRLLFSSAHRGNRDQLYEYHLDTKVLRRITGGSSEHPRGTYGADDQIVVLRLERDSTLGASEQTVHVVGAGGQLGPAIARAIPPGTIRISPTGDRLFYEQVISRRRSGGRSARESMIAMQEPGVDGGEQLLLKGREPTLTPDGEWIVFASASSAGYRLRRMRSDGTARVAISPGGSEERMPSVSPDGQFVAFVQLVNGYRKLAVRRFDGSREKVLLTDGWAEFPVW